MQTLPLPGHAVPVGGDRGLLGGQFRLDHPDRGDLPSKGLALTGHRRGDALPVEPGEQLVPHRGGGRVSVRWLPGARPIGNQAEGLGDVRGVRRGAGGVGARELLDDGAPAVTGPPGEQGVQATSQQIDVGPGPERLSVDGGHLGGQVPRRPPKLRLIPDPGKVQVRALLQGGGKAPVEQVGIPARGDDHVAQLQVPVEDPQPVGVVHCVADGGEHPDMPAKRIHGHALGHGEGPVLVDEPAPERTSHVSHDDDRVSQCIRAQHVHGHDGGVLQRSQDAGLGEQLPRVGRCAVVRAE